MIYTTIAIAIGCIIDLIICDPSWRYHPVCLIGRLISSAERFLRRIFPKNKKGELYGGVFLLIIVVSVSTMVPFAILKITWKIHPVFYCITASIMTYFVMSSKCLKTESMKVYDALQNNDLEKARYNVSMLVGRDTDKLDEAGVTKAAVETVAENTSDGSIAPLFYTAVGGPALGFLYKSINTLDSMVGYKNDKYINFGKVSAKADDVMNFIPSRIAAFIMIIASWMLKLDYKNAVYIFKRDRKKSTSPNSGQTETVCAGALNVMLLGDTYYFGKLYKKPSIGDDNRQIEAEDIKKTNNLMYVTVIISLFIAILIRITIWRSSI